MKRMKKTTIEPRFKEKARKKMRRRKTKTMRPFRMQTSSNSSSNRARTHKGMNTLTLG